MNGKIFVSTSAFINKEIINILELTIAERIRNIELGDVNNFKPEMLNPIYDAKVNKTHNFLIHNYFPPPKEDFVINLASNNKEILEWSINHCINAIDISSKLGTPFFSVHSGFCFHAQPSDLGGNQSSLEKIDRQEAYKNFIYNTKLLNRYAKKKGIKFLIENNVLSKENSTELKGYYLALTKEDMFEIINEIHDDNFGLLIDLGHLKVTSQSLLFDPVDFLRSLKKHIIAFHISDNNGTEDEHNIFTNESWFVNNLKEHKTCYFILEANKLPIDKIKEQIDLLGVIVND